MAETAQQLSPTVVDGALDHVAERGVITGVESEWAPVGYWDHQLGESAATQLLGAMEELNPDIEIDEATRDLLVKFGGAACALGMRSLFAPFGSDAINVHYREGSGLDQSDAVRRVARGLRDERGTKISRILDGN
ncbi:MAG TPA: hypothetical protein VIH90_04350 [Candidatus Saccharimonadales bacterium]